MRRPRPGRSGAEVADSSLPALSPNALAALDLTLPALARVRVALTGGGGAKYHVPPSDLRRGFHYGTCQYAKPAAGAASFPLLEVFGQVCKKCTIVVPDAAEALWRAAAFVVGHQDTVTRARADKQPHTWLRYARHAAGIAPGDQEQFDRWLDRARADQGLTDDAAALAGAWQRITAGRLEFLDAYAADCPEVEVYNGARDAVRACVDSEQRRVLDQVSAAVCGVVGEERRMYGRDPAVDLWLLVSGVWLAARSRGAAADRAAAVVQSAVARELAKAHVVDVTRLPAPRTRGGEHLTPSAWADHELALWWPHAVADACGRLEEAFEADAADASRRLLLVHDWPLTGVRDSPIAYLAASPVLGPVVPYGYRKVEDYESWNGGDAAGPSWAAVIAAPAHLVAKLEAEQAAQPRHYQTRFTAGGSLVDGPADLEAARELVRIAFPLLPGDGDGEPQVASVAVQEQRRAQRAKRGMRTAESPERVFRTASDLREGYLCWTPGGIGELELLEEMLPSLRWSVLRLDVLCGRAGGEAVWASVFGTLESVGEAGVGLSPGGRHRTLRFPAHRIVALTGAPRWDRGHSDSPIWRPYELLASIEPDPDPAPGPGPGCHIRVLPSPVGRAPGSTRPAS